MNGNEEELLRALPLRAPSNALDERIEKLLSVERHREPRAFLGGIPVWKLVAAGIVCALGAFAAGAYLRGGNTPAPAVAEVRYIIQVEPKPFDVFDWTQYPKNSAPVSVLKARYTHQGTNNKI